MLRYMYIKLPLLFLLQRTLIISLNIVDSVAVGQVFLRLPRFSF